MDPRYEINLLNTAADNTDGRITRTSKIVEVFSALVRGTEPNVDARTKDANVKMIADIAAKAAAGDPTAVSEINAIVRYTIEPRLIEAVKLFDFMGNYTRVGYNEAVMVQDYKYEGIDARLQASSGDVPFAVVSWGEYPIATQTISSGLAIDYRELQTRNFAGRLPQAIEQVQTDMRNKMAYYVISVLYNAVKEAKGIKHFTEAAGITKTAVDNTLRAMRRYGGPVNIAGDYSVVSQLNDFVGFRDAPGDAVRFGTDAIAEEIRRNGTVHYYNGAYVTELPNAINYNKLNSEGTDYASYMPEGLLFFIPRGARAPLQTFLRGDMTSMTGDDVVTRRRLTRYDMEFGAAVVKGHEDEIGLVVDTNFERPAA